MPFTKIKKDKHGLYFQTASCIFRPQPSRYSPAHPLAVDPKGGKYAPIHETVFDDVGLRVNVLFVKGTNFARVMRNTAYKEYWHNHGRIVTKGNTEDVWTP